MSARDSLTDLIDRNSQAILDCSREFAPALDRRYTSMSPDAAAIAYADEAGIAEAGADYKSAALDALYQAIVAMVSKSGLATLNAADRELVQSKNNSCIAIADQIVEAVMENKLSEVAQLRSQYAAAVADAICKDREEA